MHDVDLGRQLEQFAGEMRQAAGAGGGEVQLARLRPGERDQFVHVPRRHVGGDHQHLRHGRDQRHRREILQRVVGNPLHAGADRQRAGARDRHRVAVGRRLRDRVGAEHAALAGAVVDDHGLPCELRDLLPDHPRDDVVRPAGRERHDQPERLGREILGESRDGREKQEKGCQQPAAHRHVAHP
ncbi:hypothetical protein ACVIM5_004756 [Bradyrhizobium sp. USDA 4512]